MSAISIGVLGTGSYVPAHEVSNDDLAARVPGASPEWIVRKTGIAARRFAAPTEATSDLAVHAATAALDRAGVTADKITYLIVSTSTGDSPQPPTSSLVQHAIGATRAACLDVNVVCAGFVYALALARGLIAAEPHALVLVVAADIYSRILDFEDRRTAVLFGDGAGAAVLGAVPAPTGLIDIELVSRGDARDLIGVAAGGSRLPASAETVAAGGHYFRMRGREVRDFVLGELPGALGDLLARSGVDAADIDHFVPHQPNGVLLDEIVAKSGLTGAHTHRVLERFGNAGSASVPIALDAAARGGHLRDGDLVLLAGFGGGMAIGACLLRWHGSTPAKPVQEGTQ